MAVPDAVASAHAELKGLVQQRFAGHPDAERALEQRGSQPEAGTDDLKEALDSTGASGDTAIVAIAQTVMKLADPEGARAGRYAIPPRPLPGLRIGH